MRFGEAGRLSPTLLHSALGQLRDAVSRSDDLRMLVAALLGELLRGDAAVDACETDA
jgi:hypothetical protein